MEKNRPIRYVVDFSPTLYAIKEKLADYAVLISSEDALSSIFLELLESVLGNNTSVCLSNACGRITKILTEEFTPIDPDEILDFVKFGVDEIAANCLHAMFLDLEHTPDHYTFVVDSVLKRAEITYSYFPTGHGRIIAKTMGLPQVQIDRICKQDPSVIMFELAKAELKRDMENGTYVPESTRRYFNL